nr:hypothetical protein [Tanacetum cinerariifolium]
MATTMDQQVALDEALFPSTKRLRIGRSNFRLPSDIQSKESTLRVVYDVLRNSPFFRAFQVTADVPENYMQETMATTIDQQVALDEALVPSTQRLRIRRSNFRQPSDIQSKESTLQVVYDVLRNSPFFRAFQMDTKKSVLDLEAFREMLHISPRIPNQSFAELPSEEEILEFLRDDVLFSTIKVVSRHQTTQQYGTILPIELTTDDIKNSKAYKEYYACATGE